MAPKLTELWLSKGKDSSVIDALETCTYCPSLCHHACPVAEDEGRDTLSPWGMMSLANQLRQGLVTPSKEVYDVVSACVGCMACTEACMHGIDVASSLVLARQSLAMTGHADLPFDFLGKPDRSQDDPAIRALKKAGRFVSHPKLALVPGQEVFDGAKTLLDDVFLMAEKLEFDGLACGASALVDPGYDLYAAGMQKAFLEQAQRFLTACEGAEVIVVLSSETYHLLHDLYPRHGLLLEAEVMHVMELFEPHLRGASFGKPGGADAYWFEACHSKAALSELSEALRSHFSPEPHAIPPLDAAFSCCGGTGCAHQPSRGEALRKRSHDALLREGMNTVLTFSSDCYLSLKEAAKVAKSELKVFHVLSLMREAMFAEFGA